MRIHLSLMIVLCPLPLISLAGEKADHPLKKAKIGDYVVYKFTVSLPGPEGTTKRTVTAKNEKEVTIRTTTTFGPNPPDDKDAKIDLTKPYDLAAAEIKTDKWKKTGDGKEKIKVGNKVYDCTWVTGKFNIKADLVNDKWEIVGEINTEAEAKLWFDKSVPLGGLVKWEINYTLSGVKTNSRREITESGSAK